MNFTAAPDLRHPRLNRLPRLFRSAGGSAVDQVKPASSLGDDPFGVMWVSVCLKTCTRGRRILIILASPQTIGVCNTGLHWVSWSVGVNDYFFS